MRVGVISDTHVPTRVQELPAEVLVAFQDVDLILHAGDFVSYQVLETLQHICRVEGVCGNMDQSDISYLLPQKKEIDLGGVTVGLIHGWGGRSDLATRVRTCFPTEIDCVVFGHSHQAFNTRIDGTLLFNPGSPVSSTDRSCGFLHVSDGSITGEIIHF